jgi:hypothetical protein
MEAEREHGRTIIRVLGVFDRPSACELRDRLAGEPTADVLLDFSLVREIADAGVEALAGVLAAAGGRRVRVVGLRQHQARMIRYFGVDLDALEGRGGEPPALT